MDVIREIAKLNARCFEKSDMYSNKEEVEKLDWYVEEEDGKLVGYILFKEEKHHVECVRRGVMRKHRRLGVGLKLTRKVIRRAKRLGKHYKTYAAIDNLASINSNIRAGCFVESIDRDWICLSS